MTTTDSKGIVFLEETDIISPFHTLMNVLQQGTTDAFDDVTNLIDSKITILHRDTIAERGALTASTSTDNPLLVYVKATGLIYMSDNGATWKTLATLDAVAAAIAARTPAAWAASANWADDPAYPAVTATRRADGLITTEGAARRSGSTTTAASATLGILPENHRPAALVSRPGAMFGSGAAFPVVLTIAANGTVVAQFGATVALTQNVSSIPFGFIFKGA